MRILLVTGALTAMLGVALGAFGAHALKGRLDPQMLIVWQTAVQYHLAHALGIVLVAIAAAHWPHTAMSWAGWTMFAGVVLFSGSLYLLAFTGVRWLGAITPLGGLAFLAGWLLFAYAVWRASP